MPRPSCAANRSVSHRSLRALWRNNGSRVPSRRGCGRFRFNISELPNEGTRPVRIAHAVCARALPGWEEKRRVYRMQLPLLHSHLLRSRGSQLKVLRFAADNRCGVPCGPRCANWRVRWTRPLFPRRCCCCQNGSNQFSQVCELDARA